MLDVILEFLKALLDFLGVVANPNKGQKVEDVLPEKSASEAALEQLEAQQGGPTAPTPPAPKS